MGENLINKYTPAVTIVDECNRLDTGVGPAIAAANQVCKEICADLALAATIKVKDNNNTKSAFI